MRPINAFRQVIISIASLLLSSTIAIGVEDSRRPLEVPEGSILEPNHSSYELPLFGSGSSSTFDGLTNPPSLLSINPINDCEGDINDDDLVNHTDAVMLAGDFGHADCASGYPCIADIDKDGDVDGRDLFSLQSRFGTDCTQLNRLCGGAISYDTGTPGWHYAVNQNYGIALKFTPPSYPWTFNQVQFWPWSNSDGLNFEVHVWDDDGLGGLPGSDLILPVSHSASMTDEWENIHLPNVTITEGEFYIGWVQNSSDLFYNGSDDGPTYNGRSFMRSSDGSWSNFSDIGASANMMIRQSCQSSPPVLSNLQVSPSTLPVPLENEHFIVTISFDFEDPEGDLYELVTTITFPGGTSQGGSEFLQTLLTSGSAETDILIDSTYQAGVYLVSLELVDEFGNRSDTQSISFTLEQGAEPPLVISSFSTATGEVGDTIQIFGNGFYVENPSLNEIYFGDSLQRAQIASAAATILDVIIPEGALSGPITLETPQGTTQSSSLFTIQPMIAITPQNSRLLTNQSIQFICNRSGLDTSGIEWTINGEISPDPIFGTIDQFGAYVSPPDVPPVNPVTIRCADEEYPSYFAEVNVEIISPIPPAGGGTILAQTGGEIESVTGEAKITIPANSLDSDTAVVIESLNPEEQPVLQQDLVSLAAVRLEPSGLRFNQPVDITLKLQSWQPPGTEIPLVLLEDAGGLSDTGTRAVVDVTGLKATAQITHFSRYILQKGLDFSRADIATRWSTLSPGFAEYEIEIPPEMSFIEGLSVPVLVKRRAGKGSGPGPFLPGVTVTPVLQGYTRENTPLTAELVQPSADGWLLGTIIHIPTLPLFGEGEVVNATIYVDYPAQAGATSPETMQFDITIECLNELIFDYDQPPLLPNGAIQYTSQGRRYVQLPQKGYYRFSELNIGPQAVLSVAQVWALTGNPRDPLTLVVTGDVTVEGQIHAMGTDGEDGEHGNGSDDGGYGGIGGYLAAGAGGIGGPTSPTKWDRDGRDALYPPYGGIGGLHGYKWDNASWISVLIAGAKIWMSFGQIVTNPVGLIQYSSFVRNFYGGVQETIKYNHKDQNRVLSAGEGGKRGAAYYSSFGSYDWTHPWSFVPYFPAPMAGGGGGGSGKMRITGEPDAAGAGGGGGGGAAPNMKIVTGGKVFFAPNAHFDGHGGNGGRGGNGSTHSWTNQAAPGGGGAGGSGANLHMIASRGLINNGVMAAKAGGGGLGGEIDEDEGIILLPKTFGEFGHRGSMRLDGPLSGNIPEFMSFWGAHMGEKVISSDRWGRTGTYFEDTLFFGKGSASGFHVTKVDGVEVGTASGLEYQQVPFQLTEGLRILSVRQAIHGEAGIYADLHPWMYQYVFCFPGLEDNDQDGLANGMEDHVGSDPQDPDSDDDGLTDGEEVLIHQTDPEMADSDGDGYNDPEEIYVGTDPRDPNDHPGIDTDNDGLPDGWEIKHFGNLSQDGDDNPDQDDLTNTTEFQLRTDPNLWDTDEDGVSDGEEVFFDSDPLDANSTPEGPAYNPDSCDGIDNDLDGLVDEGFADTDSDGNKDCIDSDDDNDGLTDAEEAALGTDPLDSDTDDDNLSDYSEVRTHNTNPLAADSDADGLIDGAEILEGTLPLDPDSDDDGLLDGEEVNTYGTNPLIADTDGEGITDYDEIHVHGTDPLLRDTDGDGYDDLVEINAGTDPRNPSDYPGAGDIDEDGLPDQWEIDHFGNIDQRPDDDFDDDFLSNLVEYNIDTNPTLPDTDSDGTWDNVEVDQGSDPLDQNSTPEVCDGIDNDGDFQTDENVCDEHIDNKGREFILAFMPSEPIAPDPTLSLIITGELPTNVTIEYPINNPTWTRTVTVSRNQSATVNNLPITASTSWTSGSPQNNAFRVTSSEEVTIIMKNSKFAVRDQALALPVDSLGTSYIVANRDPRENYGSQMIVVGTQDDTSVFIDYVWPLTPLTVNLDRGEGYRGSSNLSLTGTIITADKPVAVVNGNKCAQVPDGTKYCEHLFEMAVPLNYWGTDVLASNLPRAYENDDPPYRRTYYRIMSPQDNTELFLNGNHVANLFAGSYYETYRSGWNEVSNHFTAAGPIFIVQYMNSLCDEFPYSDGCSDQSTYLYYDEYGDASMTNLVHANQFPRSYVFVRPEIDTVFVNIVAKTTDIQEGRVVLDGRPLDPSRFSVFPDANEYSHASIRIFGSGIHTSSSLQGHAMTLVGLGGYSAMTNPLGVIFRD